MSTPELRAAALALGWPEDRVEEALAGAAAMRAELLEVHASCLVFRTAGVRPSVLREFRDTRLETVRAANAATAHLVEVVATPGWHAAGST